MNILYISYWGVNDPLTISTVYPHLEILNSFSSIEKIIFVTIERDNPNTDFKNTKCPKVHHIGLFSKNLKSSILNKIIDFVRFPSILIKLAKEYEISKIIARSSLAGALAYKIYKNTDIPFFVESFEPHADYMIEAGVWKKYSLRSYFQKKWEDKQKKYASAIMPVSNNYKNKLISEGISPDKIFTIPCCVPIEKFTFTIEKRNKIRKQLNINMNDIVGIYVGKFGGMYYDEEAFEVFRHSVGFFGKDFKILIITPNNRDTIINKLKTHHLDSKNIFVNFVDHHEIPDYLSASDFAYAFYKPNYSARFLSPIKNGEYWANGLPILCPDNIGDDSTIIKNEIGGAIYNLTKESLVVSFTRINEILNNTDSKNRITDIARTHRNFSITNNIYKTLFSK